MRIIVMSDSHGNLEAVKTIVERNLGHADMFIHCGDGEREYEIIKELYPDINFHYVMGNCDNGRYPDSEVIEASNGVKIFAAHGHRYSVNVSPDRLCLAARLAGCKIAVYGHTHVRDCRTEYGFSVMNPGSCSIPRDGKPPSFGCIEITDKGILMGLFDLEL